jgi:DNA-binding NarL/FixJ family response regulator
MSASRGDEAGEETNSASGEAGRRAGPLRVLLIDCQPLFLDALTLALRRAWPEAEVFGAQSIAAAQEYLRLHAFDVVIANLETYRDAAPCPVEHLLAEAGAAPVIATANGVDGREAAQALAAGARGYLPKTMSGEAICGAVSVVLAGGVCVPPQALPDAIEREASHVLRPRTWRERQILSLLARGCSNKVIARELGLSVATVKLHVQSILRSTGARNRVEAIANARRKGLLPAN